MCRLGTADLPDYYLIRRSAPEEVHGRATAGAAPSSRPQSALAFAMAFGASFGAISVGSGLTLAQTMVLSLVMFTGASQFAFVGVATAGGSPCSRAGKPAAWRTQRVLWRTSFRDPAPPGLSRVMDRALRDRRDNRDGGEPGHPRAQRYAFWARADLVLPVAARQPVRRTHRPRGQSQRCWARCCCPAVFLALLWPSLRRREARWVARRRSGGARAGASDTARHPGGRCRQRGAGCRPTPEARRRRGVEDRDPS